MLIKSSSDVEAIPQNGTWFQLIANGTTTFNNGTNGIQKLDTVVNLAKKHGLYLLLSLTNNWNPVAPANDPSIKGRNSLSNDYGQSTSKISPIIFSSKYCLQEEWMLMYETLVTSTNTINSI